MTQKHAFSNEFPGNWRLLGEVKLPLGVAISDHIYTWLVDTLRPLDLTDRFLNKILVSAEHAAVYDPSADSETVNAHMHILIYTPEDSPSNSPSWGFFRVEKKGELHSAEPNQIHAIVFYLYREGL